MERREHEAARPRCFQPDYAEPVGKGKQLIPVPDSELKPLARAIATLVGRTYNMTGLLTKQELRALSSFYQELDQRVRWDD